MKTINPFKNQFLEFHILQSFPVTCLNRDDVGAPKTAVIGGTVRARVSSQCWKRQVRLQMRELGVICGERTKAVAELVEIKCLELGASENQAKDCGQKISELFLGSNKKSKKNNREIDEEEKKKQENNTLIFLSPSELLEIAMKLKEVQFDPEKIDLDAKKLFNQEKQTDALDIALFGRMVAVAPNMNIEAASCFSHAISTHKIDNEIDFFTAIDDLSKEPGAGHLGSVEFNSATYYRYISLNLGQLFESLGGTNIPLAVSAFIKALFLAVPAGKQNTQSGASFWDYAKIFIRNGQRMQVPFATAVKYENGGFLVPSIREMEKQIMEKKLMAGSLFQEVASYTIGDQNGNFSMDNLLDSISQYIEGQLG
jgi:CRISPR system Cascade subunit CasC